MFKDSGLRSSQGRAELLCRSSKEDDDSMFKRQLSFLEQD